MGWITGEAFSDPARVLEWGDGDEVEAVEEHVRSDTDKAGAPPQESPNISGDQIPGGNLTARRGSRIPKG